MMIKAIIVDDEEKGTSLLNHKLADFSDKLEVIAIFNEPEKALTIIKNLDIDVLFLDIEMPKINGFQFLELLGQFNFEVIFVTAYDAYVLNALRNDALDYLMKPVDPEELEAAINKLEEKISKKSNIQQNGKKDNGRLSLATAEGIYYIKKSDIITVEAMSNYSVFHVVSGNKIIVSKTLKEYETILSEDCFFRVNRSAIVNLEYVVKFRKGDVLELANGAEIEVSSTKKAMLLEKLA
ncbi:MULTISPECIES: LytR/AlgR family response regulator transcription factor [Bacteroidota]|uniref:LytR/AlgR family response regulator transcription factor n=1 Tax=Bacteroidota TaxID=976 RepID=UPI001C88ADB9|nr:LytTR family DNA-binding domain-containing protein [Elizabethkingia anophelis]